MKQNESRSIEQTVLKQNGKMCAELGSYVRKSDYDELKKGLEKYQQALWHMADEVENACGGGLEFLFGEGMTETEFVCKMIREVECGVNKKRS